MARTTRLQRCRPPWRLCRAHADEGEVRGYWLDGHSDNARWKQEDASARAQETRCTAEQHEAPEEAES